MAQEENPTFQIPHPPSAEAPKGWHPLTATEVDETINKIGDELSIYQSSDERFVTAVHRYHKTPKILNRLAAFILNRELSTEFSKTYKTEQVFIRRSDKK